MNQMVVAALILLRLEAGNTFLRLTRSSHVVCFDRTSLRAIE